MPRQGPEQGEPAEQILDDFDRLVVPHVVHWSHPGFLAYFAAGGSAPGVLAESLIAALTGHGGPRGGLDTSWIEWNHGPLLSLLLAEFKKFPRLEAGGLGEFMRGEMYHEARKHFDPVKLKERVGFDVDELMEMIDESITNGAAAAGQVVHDTGGHSCFLQGLHELLTEDGPALADLLLLVLEIHETSLLLVVELILLFLEELLGLVDHLIGLVASLGRFAALPVLVLILLGLWLAGLAGEVVTVGATSTRVTNPDRRVTADLSRPGSMPGARSPAMVRSGSS